MTAPPDDPTPSADHQIVVQHLTKRFGDFTALADINLEIRRGAIAVVIGGSGAGKTTLLKMLIGLDKPTKGRILIDGVDTVPLSESRMKPIRQKVGMVFQYSALLDSLNVMDNVAFPLREHTRLSRREIHDKVLDKLSALQLEGIEDRFPSQLSGGMKKRVGLARALMLEPEILMYDEPTSGLDPLSSRLVDRMIVETAERFNVTSVVISHDMAGALKIAHQIFLLAKGRLVTSGTPAELVRGDNPLVHEFFEASGISAQQLVAEPEAAVTFQESSS